MWVQKDINDDIPQYALKSTLDQHEVVVRKMEGKGLWPGSWNMEDKNLYYGFLDTELRHPSYGKVEFLVDVPDDGVKLEWVPLKSLIEIPGNALQVILVRYDMIRHANPRQDKTR